MPKINKKSIIILAAVFWAVVGIIWWWAEKNIDIGESQPKGTLQVEVTIGPFCPVEQVGVPCPGPPDAYTSRQVTVFKADGKSVVFKKNLDEHGFFSEDLPAGDYVVSVWPGGIVKPPSQNVTIKTIQITKLNFDIDTGIR